MSKEPRRGGARRGFLTTLKWSPFVVLGLAGAGILYQSIAAASDRRSFPAPGRLVDVGGFHMHLQCSGDGRPTVLLDAGNGGISSTWAWIQPRVAPDARVCSFDRAGLGWSDAGSPQRDAVTVSRELKALLDAAGERGPFVYVGHSFGGIYARVFAAEYPELVAGMVLVDASHPEQFASYPEDVARQVELYSRVMRLSPLAAHLGIMRATNFLGRMAEGLPEPDYSRTAAMAALASHFRVANAEFAAWEQNAERLADAADLGDLPLAVVTAGVAPGAPDGLLETHHELQRDLATLSSRSRHEIVDGADHLSLLMRREHAERTARAIRDLLAVVRGVPVEAEVRG